MSTVYTQEDADAAADEMSGNMFHGGFLTRRALGPGTQGLTAESIDATRAWSDETFGPGARTKGVIDHIRKELIEVEEDPTDIKEWADVVILAIDGATRAGASGADLIQEIEAKWAKNKGRVWPDWRTSDPDKAIEHDRSHD